MYQPVSLHPRLFSLHCKRSAYISSLYFQRFFSHRPSTSDGQHLHITTSNILMTAANACRAKSATTRKHREKNSMLLDNDEYLTRVLLRPVFCCFPLCFFGPRRLQKTPNCKFCWRKRVTKLFALFFLFLFSHLLHTHKKGQRGSSITQKADVFRIPNKKIFLKKNSLSCVT